MLTGFSGSGKALSVESTLTNHIIAPAAGIEQRLKGKGLKAIARGRAKNLKAWAAEAKPTAQIYKCFAIIGFLDSKGQRQYRFACLYSGAYFFGQFNQAQRDLIMRLFEDWPKNAPCPADAWALLLEALLGDGGALY
jgi:hypothetical protein